MTPVPPESAALLRGHSLGRRVAFIVGLAMVLILGCSVLDLQAEAKIVFLRERLGLPPAYESSPYDT